MLIQLFFVASFASEAERKLHSRLFDKEVYNPRVIQDSWRKANRNDFANIGTFAEDKCTGYNPKEETQAELGSMMAIDDFATENPYKNFDRMKRNFTCTGNRTIRIRLDPTRGFHIEKNYDWLTIMYTGYYKKLSGTMSALDSRFRQYNWYNLETNWLQLEFVADYTQTRSGFKFEVKCQDDQNSDENSTKSVPITNQGNDETNQLIQSGWTKQVMCVNPHETVSYRLKTELISDGETFDSTINNVISIEYGGLKASFNHTFGGWIDTTSNKISATYTPPKTKSPYDYGEGSGSGAGEGSGFGSYSNNVVGDIDYQPRSGITETSNVLFNIETKCEVRG